MKKYQTLMDNFGIEMTPRKRTPRWLTVAAQGATILAALAVAAIPIMVVKSDPVTVYSEMFLTAVENPFVRDRVLNRAAPLILAGLAVYLPLRSGLYNIGAEGQLIAGGLATLWVGVRVPGMLGLESSGLAVMGIAFLAAFLVGAVWVYVPVYLYNKYEVNEILTTLMLVFTAERLSTYLITGPLQAAGGTFPRTDQVGFELPLLPVISETRINIGIVVALLAVAVTWLLINRTRLGYEIILSGSNEGAAVQTGISRTKITFVVFTFGAALAGLAGFLEIAGNQQSIRPGWSPGYGWTAIPIALLGRRSSIQTMLAGLLFGVIFVGSSWVEVTLGVPSAISQIIEALLILFLISAEVFRSYRIDIVLGSRSVRESVAKIASFDSVGGK